MMKPIRIISGGQTGADMGALLGARDCGIPTGGIAPKGYRTECGYDQHLRDFGLQEFPSFNYRHRTIMNIDAADMTLVFGNPSSRGTAFTVRMCRELEHPHIINPTISTAQKFYHTHRRNGIVNVAGNRESVMPGIMMEVRTFIRTLFGGGPLDGYAIL